jgi:hypothetical protein
MWVYEYLVVQVKVWRVLVYENVCSWCCVGGCENVSAYWKCVRMLDFSLL